MEKKQPSRWLKIFLMTGLVLTGTTLLWARFLATKGLIVKEYAINSEKIAPQMNGLKIIHFSDIHYGSTTDSVALQSMVDTINDLKPDIAVFTGDLADENIILSAKEVKTVTKILASINCDFKYAVAGNHDKKPSKYKEILKNSHFKILSNKEEEIYYLANEPIKIIGFPSAINDSPDYKMLEKDDPIYRIVLIHEPDPVDIISPYGVDLVLSGHSHNGQIRIPFVGALYTPPLARNYYENYYRINKTDLFVSSGVGTSMVKLRFLNKPSINLYRLYSNQ